MNTILTTFCFLGGSACVSDCGDLLPVSSLLPPKPPTPLVRLVDGASRNEGRVEVLYDGIWGTVCDDGWDLNDASVVCKELGFGDAKQATQTSKFGQGKLSFERELKHLSVVEGDEGDQLLILTVTHLMFNKNHFQGWLRGLWEQGYDFRGFPRLV